MMNRGGVNLLFYTLGAALATGFNMVWKRDRKT